MLRRSTVKLLRFHFSFFLMPVYWFALSQVLSKNWQHAILIFVILHFLVYPSSNGYNSYMDRDEGSIGGLKAPPQPTLQLFYVTLFMDLAAIGLGLLISPFFAGGVTLYILASRAYSYRGIRLKKYPVAGYLTVAICQGALVFDMVFQGSHAIPTTQIPVSAMIGSSLLIGGFYPLTQIYQHQADEKDGVKTISYFLGYKGTFIFAALVYIMAFASLGFYFFSSLELKEFAVLATSLVPVLVYFLAWGAKVWKDRANANFTNTMRMNILASFCTNTGFIIILLINHSNPI
jgi:1,4-dihydroxy-2-naphthoate polyprenyltransferase